ncbi:NAD(P)H-binding protein [Myxococcus sp. K38C18041901]|uniref:NAD(P)H-binding protein n=1 Tax=Myxococcus guangdongensis TaxID=2906760 RepID=UPI0020A73537|nr:NAD(P)H-binding protein [Myxococcus guangdongensis]MCP3061662.1 NAD(P)H-binding protein [Myxococcus guangdongensis]
MKVVLFGATGMVGQGILRECLLAPDVEQVLAVVRSPTGQRHEKLREVLHQDFLDYGAIEASLQGYDTCFFCLGVSSAGMDEQAYSKVTYDVTLAAAGVLLRLNPTMTFIFVSGAGTDGTEKGRVMWARVKGRAENALLRMPFRAAYMFRPAFIQPLHGIVSRTRLYRALYAVLGPLYPVLKRLAPRFVTTTEAVGLAMLEAARSGAPKQVLENDDINALAARVAR